jgi:hypothetical protein
MTDDSDLEPIDLGAGAPYAATPAPGPPPSPYATTVAATWAPGWYADPWTAGQYRYWNGQTWTGETNRWGPATANVATPGGATDPWPSSASPVAGGYGWPDRPAAGAAPVGGRSSRRRGPIVAGIIVLVIVLFASAAIGYAINSHSHSHSSVQVAPDTTLPGARTPSTVGPTSPPGRVANPDPDQGVLNRLVVQQSDINPVRTVLLIPNGNQLSEPTLDLCNGTFASEALRTARVQVADLDSKGNASLSTEAVLYRNADASSQAFAELRRVRSRCPDTPVPSPVGEGTATTLFHAAPDATWANPPGVDRLAYSITSTQGGKSSSSIAVYLRRGRALLGVYFPQPKGVQPIVAGQRSVEGIVGVFEARMAKLPASVVNGTSNA